MQIRVLKRKGDKYFFALCDSTSTEWTINRRESINYIVFQFEHIKLANTGRNTVRFTLIVLRRVVFNYVQFLPARKIPARIPRARNESVALCCEFDEIATYELYMRPR